MLEKLQSIILRHKDLSFKLSDPALHQNPTEYQKVARDEAKLRPMVELFETYLKTKQDFEDAQEMLKTEADAELKEMAKEEVSELGDQITELEQKIKIELLPKDPNDDKNIFLEIRAGTGGEEAALFASDLMRMYTRYAEQNKWRCELISMNSTGIGGVKEVILRVSGDQVYSRLKYESGVHRVQRVPKTESSGRVHTSAITVAVMPEVEDVEIEIDETEIRIDVFRAGGAGGQHVNKTDSAVRITHLPTGIVVSCQDEKSQHKNKAKAMKVLKARLYDQMEKERRQKEAQDRKDQVGGGDRSEKIRTYNFPQSRVTDHRIGLTLHQLDEFIAGQLDVIIDPLITHYQTEALKNVEGN